MLKEFKEFAMKGNVLDLAIGVIIGGAFGKIVTSLVNDMIMPIIGVITGGINLSGLKIVIKPAVGAIPALSINYGQFLQVTVDFIIIAFSIFLFVKAINQLKRKEEEKSEELKTPPMEQVLLQEIRDLLKENK